MDDFSENKITCYVADSQDLSKLRRIPGSGSSQLPERETTRRSMECSAFCFASQDVSGGGLVEAVPPLDTGHPTEGFEPTRQKPPEELLNSQDSPASTWSL